MEERCTHPDYFVLDDPQRIEDDWIQCIRVDILYEAGLSELAVLLRVLVDIGKGLSFGGIHISLDSFIK